VWGRERGTDLVGGEHACIVAEATHGSTGGTTPCMATQLRDYRIHDGELGRFVEAWRAHLAPLRQAHGFTIPGRWTVPDEDRFVWLLQFPGDWDAFAEADAAYYASPERAAIDPDPARLIEEQRTLRLTEVALP
jgi:NIPSNAP